MCKSIVVYYVLGYITMLTFICAEYNEGILPNFRSNIPYKRWFPVKEFHYGEPLEVRKKFYKRWFPVKEFHYGEPIEVKKRSNFVDKRWYPVKEFHYGEPIEVRKRN
ncbi:hypothetical protein EWB00_006948 [Schistosoma japonicum]|uniref:Uncharacterized protein n=2 Tax=Schistosoma japonicum TaxID=6182 RepID=A0A4Z2CWI8_SCHJA|nr:hypothetical protein EWB00_006948 [Schistosoma japonicum]